MGDQAAAAEYRRLFQNGSKWIDANLFNGEYYTQKIEGRPKEEVFPGVLVGMGAANPEKPDYQMGEACLVDQLLGQYMAHVAGLGYLLDEEHVLKTMKSVFRNNYVPNLSEHDCVQRTYALNDDGGVLVASYPHGKRPEIPFPYFAESWTGEEYQFAAHLAFEGMLTEAQAVVESARLRHDGERRNPWNEPECGHHYARALSAWALVVALSGFHYSGVDRKLTLAPRLPAQNFRCFWSAPSGWGQFTQSISTAAQTVEVQAQEGSLALASLALAGNGKTARKTASVRIGQESLTATLREDGKLRTVVFDREVRVAPGQSLLVSLRA